MTNTEQQQHAPVLYIIGCAAPPILEIADLIEQAQARGWDTCLVLTPTAAAWLRGELPTLEAMTGHPVRSQYKAYGEPDVLPAAEAMLVAPVSNNSLNKWALGISDTLALGLITEAIGLPIPLVALPHLGRAQHAHPAVARSVATLREAGVAVLLNEDDDAPYDVWSYRRPFPWGLALDAVDVTGP